MEALAVVIAAATMSLAQMEAACPPGPPLAEETACFELPGELVPAEISSMLTIENNYERPVGILIRLAPDETVRCSCTFLYEMYANGELSCRCYKQIECEEPPERTPTGDAPEEDLGELG